MGTCCGCEETLIGKQMKKLTVREGFAYLICPECAKKPKDEKVALAQAYSEKTGRWPIDYGAAGSGSPKSPASPASTPAAMPTSPTSSPAAAPADADAKKAAEE